MVSNLKVGLHFAQSRHGVITVEQVTGARFTSHFIYFDYD